MMTTAIRGAVTVDSNTQEAIKNATIELLKEMLTKNGIEPKDISHVFFTMTKDLDAVYPAKFARDEMGFKYVPMMCFQELDIENSLKMALRIMLVINKEIVQQEVKHIYLKGAQNLRPDLM